MTIEEEIARVIANAQNVPFVGATQKRIAAAVMPLVKRAQADALREAARKAQQAFVDEQGGVGYARVRTDWLHAEADRIENEGAGA